MRRVERLGVERFGKITLLRPDGTATYHLASVVDDIEFEITHVIRGKDHRPNEDLHRRLTRRSGREPPEYVHHGLVLGPDGRKLSKRARASVADLRERGDPRRGRARVPRRAWASTPRRPLDPARIRRLAVEAIAAMSGRGAR